MENILWCSVNIRQPKTVVFFCANVLQIDKIVCATLTKIKKYQLIYKKSKKNIILTMNSLTTMQIV